MPIEKVYCEDCKNYHIEEIGSAYCPGGEERCLAEPIEADTYLRREMQYADPAYRNKWNACEFYEAKGE